MKVLRQYVDFEGRARRTEYWMFFLFNAIIYVVLSALSTIAAFLDMGLLTSLFYGVTSLYALAVFLPSLGVTVRRLHDIGKSGWWFLIGLIPLVGGIWLIVLLVGDSQPGDNLYGPNPKGVEGFNQ